MQQDMPQYWMVVADLGRNRAVCVADRLVYHEQPDQPNIVARIEFRIYGAEMFELLKDMRKCYCQLINTNNYQEFQLGICIIGAIARPSFEWFPPGYNYSGIMGQLVPTTALELTL